MPHHPNYPPIQTTLFSLSAQRQASNRRLLPHPQRRRPMPTRWIQRHLKNHDPQDSRRQAHGRPQHGQGSVSLGFPRHHSHGFGDLSYLNGEWRRDVAFAGFDVSIQMDVSADKLINGVAGIDPQKRAELIKVLDIDLSWRLHKVSDGQRRRVQICMDLLKPYKVLLLDEITVDLNVLARADLLQFLRKECEERGAMIIYATLFSSIAKAAKSSFPPDNTPNRLSHPTTPSGAAADSTRPSSGSDPASNQVTELSTAKAGRRLDHSQRMYLNRSRGGSSLRNGREKSTHLGASFSMIVGRRRRQRRYGLWRQRHVPRLRCSEAVLEGFEAEKTVSQGRHLSFTALGTLVLGLRSMTGSK